MPEDKKYNGWTNYETWNWKLWMDNDQGTQEMWQENAEQCWKNSEADKYSTHIENATRILSEMLKDDAEENNPLKDAGPYTDILGAAISEINWYEIAESLMDDIDKTEEEEN